MRRRHTVEDSVRSGGLARNASKSSVPSAPEDDEPKVQKREEKPKDNTDAIACQLALKHRLMLSEVKCIIREFLKAKQNEYGGLGQDEFDLVMARIFDVPAINKKVSKDAYLAAGVEKEINIDKFLVWYVQNMFTQVNALTADQHMANSNALAYQVAAKYKVSNYAIDKIKSKFDFYDLDKSGKICYDEFLAMFCSILKVSDPVDLNPDRIKRFWAQVDKNGDGGIDFEEFVDWYLRYFSPDTEDDEWDMSGPLQKFYEGFNPTVQRRNHCEHKKSHSLDDQFR